MMKHRIAAVIVSSAIFGMLSPVQAQIAGTSTVLHVPNVMDVDMIARGWSVKKSIMGKTVYNDKTEAIGKVEDLIIEPNRDVSYLILGVGGFLGLGRHDVAVRSSDIMELDGRIVMQGGSKAELQAMPSFHYTRLNVRDRLIADAESVMALCDGRIEELRQQSTVATNADRSTMDRQVQSLQSDRNELRVKLDEMKSASNARWRAYEADINKMMARIKATLREAVS